MLDLDIRTAEDLASEAAARRAERVKAECKRRIYAIVSSEAQLNIVGAMAAGQLDADEQAAHEASVQWISDMRAACAAIIANGSRDYTDDAEWPHCSNTVAVLAEAF